MRPSSPLSARRGLTLSDLWRLCGGLVLAAAGLVIIAMVLAAAYGAIPSLALELGFPGALLLCAFGQIIALVGVALLWRLARPTRNRP